MPKASQCHVRCVMCENAATINLYELDLERGKGRFVGYCDEHEPQREIKAEWQSRAGDREVADDSR
jgi:phage-related protein